MKNNKDLFSENMPSQLQNKILKNADQLLLENKKLNRKSFLGWTFATGLTALAASFVIIVFKNKIKTEDSILDIAGVIPLVEDIDSEEDIEMFADFEVVEDLDLLELMDDET